MPILPMVALTREELLPASPGEYVPAINNWPAYTGGSGLENYGDLEATATNPPDPPVPKGGIEARNESGGNLSARQLRLFITSGSAWGVCRGRSIRTKTGGKSYGPGPVFTIPSADCRRFLRVALVRACVRVGFRRRAFLSMARIQLAPEQPSFELKLPGGMSFPDLILKRARIDI